MADKNLRKVSISTQGLLLKNGEIDDKMVDFIKAIKNKYRVYLITRLEVKEEQ